MNEIYAIDPSAPEDLKDIKFMLEKFGMREGRFLAKYPSNWIEIILENSGKLLDIDRSRLIRLLDVHRDYLFDVEAEFIRSRDWIDNAERQKDNRKIFSRVLAADPNSLNAETLKSFLWDEGSTIDTSRGAHIPMSVDSYALAVKPLFFLCNEVHIADPYFQLRNGVNMDRGRFEVLRAFFKIADESKKCESFIIHFNRVPFLKEADQERFIEKDLNYLITDLEIQNLKITYDLNEDMTHGRYIFSVKGGLQFDYGFEPKKGKTNHVHWLSQKELDPILSFYDL
jgi:hypothetical protein